MSLRPSRANVILAVFLAVYAVCYVYPTFLAQPAMRFVPPVPAIPPVGSDLKLTADYSRAWLTGDATHDFRTLYPPFVTLLYAPVSMVDHSTAVAVITVLTTVCFLGNSLLFPVVAGSWISAPLLTVLAFAGMTSYGLQFELERGQFNVITMSLCSIAIWLFHRGPRFQALAFGLLSLAVQFKLFPLIFGLLLVDDWRAWRNNVRRGIAFGAVAFAGLFVLGWERFTVFMADIVAARSAYFWEGNHSIRSYASGAVAQGVWPAGANSLAAILLIVTAVCLLITVVQAYRRNVRAIDPDLLLACTVTALLIPPVSHDYTLPVLAGPIVMALMASCREYTSRSIGRLATALAAGIAATYATLLFSYTVKPALLENTLPFLMTILVATAAQSIVRGHSTTGAGAPHP